MGNLTNFCSISKFSREWSGPDAPTSLATVLARDLRRDSSSGGKKGAITKIPEVDDESAADKSPGSSDERTKSPSAAGEKKSTLPPQKAADGEEVKQ